MAETEPQQASDDDEQEPGKVSIRYDTVLIQGGHFKQTTVWSGWTTPFVEKEGRRFVVLDKGNPRFKAWIGQNMKMVDYLAQCRNAEVGSLFGQAMAALDPSAELATASPDGKRKELAPQLPEIIDVPVHIDGQAMTISMLQAWHSQHKVSIEITEPNLQALLGEAPEMDDSRVPICTEPNVKYNHRTKKVFCAYLDAKKKKTRRHYESCDSYDDAAAQQREVNKMARVCQLYYDTHHGVHSEE